jgi:hypothetical protein
LQLTAKFKNQRMLLASTARKVAFGGEAAKDVFRPISDALSAISRPDPEAREGTI